MDENFNEIKERVETGLRNNIPFQPRLIMLGEIVYAVERGDMTPNQGRQLEELLGLREILDDYEQIREQGFFGELIST